MFDIASYRASLEPPAIRTADGTLHEGRLLSVLEYETFHATHAEAIQGFLSEAGMPVAEVVALFRAIATAVALPTAAVDEVLSLPASALSAVVLDLLGLLRGRAKAGEAAAASASPSPPSG